MTEELRLINGQRVLEMSHLNRVHYVHDRVDEMVEFIASSDRIDCVHLDAAPIEENLAHRISLAITSNFHINEVVLTPGQGAVMRDVLPWMTVRGTLEHMTSLQKVCIHERYTGMSVQDWDLIFPLLLTSSSLQELRVHFNLNDCDDSIMSLFSDYLSEATSLVSLELSGGSLSQPAITCLCSGFSHSSLRNFTLWCSFSVEANREADAECLALAIAQSSLDTVRVRSQLSLVLPRTTPVRCLDFVFSQIEYCGLKLLTINRKWKPILTANIPLGLWPEILHKAHASPETSHGPEDILFFLLREKADLIPRTSLRTGKRKRAD